MNIGGADGKDLEMQGGRGLRASVEDTTSGPRGPRYSSGWKPVGCVCGSKGGQHEWVGEPRQVDSVPVGRGVFQTPPESQDLLLLPLFWGWGAADVHLGLFNQPSPDPSHTSYPVSGVTSPAACGVSNFTPLQPSPALSASGSLTPSGSPLLTLGTGPPLTSPWLPEVGEKPAFSIALDQLALGPWPSPGIRFRKRIKDLDQASGRGWALEAKG